MNNERYTLFYSSPNTSVFFSFSASKFSEAIADKSTSQSINPQVNHDFSISELITATPKNFV